MSFTIGILYTCMKDTFALQLKLVSIINMGASLFSPFFVGVAGNLFNITARLQTLILVFLLGIKAKKGSCHRKGGQTRLALHKTLSLLKVTDDLY